MRYLATVTIGPELVLQITRDQIHSPFVSALFEFCEISTYLMQGTAALSVVLWCLVGAVAGNFFRSPHQR